MSDQEFQKYEAKMNEYEQRIRSAATEQEKIDITKEAMQFAAGAGQMVPVDQLDSIISFATGVADSILSAIISTAGEMRSDVVPVGFIEDLRPRLPEFISAKMYRAVSELGVPVGFDGGVPDDLSGFDL